jgi:DNA primase
LPSEKVEILNALVPVLERVRDQRLRIFYLQEVADRLSVTAQWVAQQLKQNLSQGTERTHKIQVPAAPKKLPTEESILVQFMLQKPEYLELINASGVLDKFASDEARMVAQQIVERYCQNPNDFDRLGASLISLAEGYSGAQELLTNQAAWRAQTPLDDAGERQLIQDCLVRVRERDLKIRSKSILNSIKANQDTSDEKLEVFLKIAREHKGPKSP